MRRLRLAGPRAAFGLGIVAAAGLLAAGIPAGRTLTDPPQARSVTIGGPFTLTTASGQRLSSADLAGRPYALFFGFTQCPDVCPTTLYDLTLTLRELGERANGFRAFFVTVDPERDTPELLRTYLTSFDPRITALTGEPAEIAAAAAAFGATYRKVPTQDGYTMDHTATVYLMDSRGRFAGALDIHESAEIRLAKLARLLAR